MSGECVILPPFPWTGANSVDERYVAATALAKHIGTVARNWPGYSHLIVAHSHGGNVALQAIASQPGQATVDALVCLNTPFVHIRARALDILDFALHAIQPLACAIWIGLISFAVHWRGVYPGQRLRPLLMTAVVALSLVPIAALLTRPYHRFRRWLIALLERRQATRSASMLSHFPELPIRLLCVTARRDEAYLLLSGVDRLTSLVVLPMYIALGLALFSVTVGKAVAESVALVGVFASSWWATGDRLTAANLLLLIGSIGLYFSGVLLMVVVLPVLRSTVLSYGERPLDSALLDIRVKPHPPTGATFRAMTLPGKGWFKHSSLHSDPDTVRIVAEWYRDLPELNVIAPADLVLKKEQGVTS